MGNMPKIRLGQYKQGRLVEHFVAGTMARTVASLCGVNRKTAALYFLRLRETIAYELEAETANMLGGEIEVDVRAYVRQMFCVLLGAKVSR